MTLSFYRTKYDYKLFVTGAVRAYTWNDLLNLLLNMLYIFLVRKYLLFAVLINKTKQNYKLFNKYINKIYSIEGKINHL